MKNEIINTLGSAAQRGICSLPPQTTLSALAVPAVCSAIHPFVGLLGFAVIVLVLGIAGRHAPKSTED